MLEKIRAYSQKHKRTTPSKMAASIDLAVIKVYPSQLLWRTQLTIYLAMLLLAFIALLPFFVQAFYWMLLWLLFALAVSANIQQGYCVRKAAAMSFEVKQNRCQLNTNAGSHTVTISGDLLLWSWIVLIPLRENLTAKQHFLIVLRDSVTPKEWRLLRMWVKTCLHQKP